MTIEDAVVDISQDWLQACSVQERFMRGRAPKKYRVDYSASCRQMRALGGDCYDFSHQADGQLAMLVGDASGKGVAAALMIASVQASLRTAALFTGSSLTALLRVVNAQACASSLADRYATLFYAVLDQTARTLRYVNAGHNPPIVFHRDGSIDWLQPSGAPVGLLPGATWQERVVRLQPADRVLAYTDGVTEACSPSGKEWGAEGLLQAANGRGTASADELVWSILDSMDNFSRGVQTDRRYCGRPASPLTISAFQMQPCLSGAVTVPAQRSYSGSLRMPASASSPSKARFAVGRISGLRAWGNPLFPSCLPNPRPSGIKEN